MLDLKFVRENPEIVRKAIRDKGEDSSLPICSSFLLWMKTPQPFA